MAQQDVQNEGCEKVPPAAPVILSMKVQFLVKAPKATAAVEFYKAAFDAVETARTTQPKRKADQELPHVPPAEVQFAGASVIISDLPDESEPEMPESVRSPILLETKDLEAAIAKAIGAGAEAEGEIEEAGGRFGAMRSGKVKDPFGYIWTFISAVDEEPSADVEA